MDGRHFECWREMRFLGGHKNSTREKFDIEMRMDMIN